MSLLSVARSLRGAVRIGRRGPGRPEHFLHIPSNLRTTDPSFSTEFAAGAIGLRSGVLKFSGTDLFAPALTDTAQAREVFGFAWLGHLEAARTPLAEQQIRSALVTWSRHAARYSALAAEPAVMARRALSLLTHADAGLATASGQDFDVVMDLVASEFSTLAREVRRMPVSEARLTAHIALVCYALSAGLPAPQVLDLERRLAVELQRQIQADGGHVSRNPGNLLDVALDLVPLRRLYVASQRPVPDSITSALSRLTTMLQFLQMPDRSLARFNGMGATQSGDLFTVLRQLAPEPSVPGTSFAADTGYVRLSAGASAVLIDTGPGPDSLPGEAAFAGALSFEFGAGTVSLIVNCGSGREAASKPNMRATSAHSTLALAGASSAPLVGGRSGYARQTLEAAPGKPHKLTAAFDGYKARHGEVHHRTLTLATDGLRLDGTDWLEPTQASSTATAYEIHFHLHPSVFVEPDADRRSIRLRAGDGSVWMFSAEELVPSIEASIFYASASGPKPTVQLVLRSTTHETRNVSWHLVRQLNPTVALAPDTAAQTAAPPAT